MQLGSRVLTDKYDAGRNNDNGPDGLRPAPDSAWLEMSKGWRVGCQMGRIAPSNHVKMRPHAAMLVQDKRVSD